MIPGMATHQDNRPVTGRPPLTILRESERVSLRALQDNYLPASGKLLTTSGIVDSRPTGEENKKPQKNLRFQNKYSLLLVQ